MHTLLLCEQPGASAVTAWIAGAVRRGEKVLYELAPGEDADTVLRSASRDGLGTDAVASGQLEIVDPAGLRAESSGRADGLHAVHRSRLDRARDEGWAGLAVTSAGDVLSAVAPDEPIVLVHDRSIAPLVGQGMSALCRFSVHESPCVLDPLLSTHRDVDDEIWGATLVDDRLRVRGEIDASDVERVRPVLHGAVAAGVRAVDLAELRFCSAAGMRSFVDIAEGLAERGDKLVVHDPSPIMMEQFTLFDLTEHPGVRMVETRGAR